MNRFKSPILWGVVIGVVLTQVQQLSTKSSVNGWDVAIACLTVAVAAVGAINNPTDKEHF